MGGVWEVGDGWGVGGCGRWVMGGVWEVTGGVWGVGGRFEMGVLNFFIQFQSVKFHTCLLLHCTEAILFPLSSGVENISFFWFFHTPSAAVLCLSPLEGLSQTFLAENQVYI